MSPLAVSFLLLAGLVVGAGFGITLGQTLARDHMNPDARDIIKLGMGLIATLAALVLGLLVAATKETYDAQAGAIKKMATNVLLLDRLLARYGTETREARALLRHATVSVLKRMDSANSRASNLVSKETIDEMDRFYDKVASLTPREDARRYLKERSLNIITELSYTRASMIAQIRGTIPVPFLTVLVFWLVILFASYGLLAPRNATVVVILMVCALSVAGALFLILEMDRPFEGIMRIPSIPLQNALAAMAD